ncbi:baseplate multidomain protein megatron [Maricaulis parjimensis]|uniref:baseplate multidomain protein megatron n=1 Tax=Maricaulis parjimensis TaxID=144023 RepID=UPI00193A3C35|nr:glycoside hydrolase/phage tail family protein [Maricaulis parjimensis]
MAQLVVTAGQAALKGVQHVGPALARFAADTAVDALFRERRDGPRLSELEVQTSTDGAPMARVWGRARITGQVIWAARFREQFEDSGGGKGGPAQRDYAYSLSFAVGLCEGEISGIGRIWANGSLLDQSRYPVRVHHGAPDQAPDALIQTIEGADAPGFRGTAYVVLEDWPLEAFGQRIPNLSFEVFRQSGQGRMESLLQGVNLIPGTGEFAYADTVVMRVQGEGEEVAENVHNGRGLPDLVAALDDLERDLPECRSVQLVVAWFGDDLRCGDCSIRPCVETADKVTRPAVWSVAGLDRGTARLVSQVEGRPAYGGTPDDASVIAAIRQLKARGFAVTLYPFILMDIPAGNGLPDPYGGAEQAAHPWRGRVSCHPARDQAGSVDGTAAAAAQVSAFFGTVSASDFSVSGDTVSYAGPAEWSCRRFILHQAALAQAAGGVDGFLIGSEMVGLTTVSDETGGHPAVTALCDLAGEARSLLGPDTRLSYAADWTEYGGYARSDGTRRFHLDSLWSHPEIDAVAIDWYEPLSDWRDGAEHLDAALWASPYEAGYLAAGVEGGEGHDWYYASAADRETQIRTPIMDGAYGEAWIWRVKDVRAWWCNAHHERIAGVRQEAPTSWVPEGKPLWFTEIGCPAIDKGANQPNLFSDPKSAESGWPHFSDGTRDDLIQRRALEAWLTHWSDPAKNPVSSVYGTPMVDVSLMHAWAWDARPFPAFPGRSDIWSDGENWRRGHWLNGRAGQVLLADLVTELAEAAGLDAVDVSRLDDVVTGYWLDRPMSARAALEPLVSVLGMGVHERADAVHVVSAGAHVDSLALAEPAFDGEAVWTIHDPALAELPDDVRLYFSDDMADYRPGLAQAVEAFGTVRSEALSVNLIADPDLARRWCRARLDDIHARASSLTLSVPPLALGLESGDGLSVDGRSGVVELRQGDLAGRVRLRPPSGRRLIRVGSEAQDGADGPRPPVRPVLVVMDSALGDGGGPLLAARVQDWPGALDVHANGQWRTRIERMSGLGSLTAALAAGPVGYWDEAGVLELELPGFTLASRTRLDVINGANRLVVQQADGDWEILGFAEAELIGVNRFRLTGLLRGLAGSPIAAVEAGARVVWLTEALTVLPLEAHEVGEALTVSAVAAGWPVESGQAVAVDHVHRQRALWPLPVVHVRADWRDGELRIRWIRQTRTGGDDWGAPDVPLGEAAEAYRIALLDGESRVLECEAGTPERVLTEAELVSVFGSVPEAVTVEIAQVSARTGPGRAVRRVLTLQP